MPPWLEQFLLAFVPLFVAIDVVGLIPIYLSMASNVDRDEQRTVIWQALTTALLVGAVFLFLGNAMFRLLGITVSDFQIAGGLILLALAGQDLLSTDVRARFVSKEFGVVPLGMPLIAGPGMLTSILTLTDVVGVSMTLLALVANLAIVLVGLRFADRLAQLVGVTLMRALSRLVALLLAAIAIHLIRQGWQGTVS